MKKNYFAPQMKSYHLDGFSALCNDRSIPVSTETKTEGESGSWSKQFWGVAEDDQEENTDDVF